MIEYTLDDELDHDNNNFTEFVTESFKDNLIIISSIVDNTVPPTATKG